MAEEQKREKSAFAGALEKIIMPSNEPGPGKGTNVQDYIPELKSGGNVKEVIGNSTLKAPQTQSPRQAEQKPQAEQKAEEKVSAKPKISKEELEDENSKFRHTLNLLGQEGDSAKSPPRRIPVATLLLVKNTDYQKALTYMAKTLSLDYGSVLMVTLSEPYMSLSARFSQENIDVSKFTFIDAATMQASGSVRPPESANVAYVASPNSLVELSLAMSQAMKGRSAAAVLFDSVSTMLVYEKDSVVSKFLHSVANKFRSLGVDCYFSALETDSAKDAVKDLALFVDRVSGFREFVAEQYARVGLAAPLPLGGEPLPQQQQNAAPAPQRTGSIMSEMEYLREKIDEARQSASVQMSLDEMRQKFSSLEGMHEKLVRLQDLSEDEREKYAKMSTTLEEMREKLKSLSGIGEIEEQIKEIYRKIEEHDEKSQLSGDLKKSLETQKSGEFKEGLEEIRAEVAQMEDKIGKVMPADEVVHGFSKQLDSIRGRMEETHRELTEHGGFDAKLLEKMAKMEESLAKLEKRIEADEIERYVRETDAQAHKLAAEKAEIQKALEHFTDEEYRRSRESELKSQFERLTQAEEDAREKREVLLKRIETLKDAK